jgi:hypothetical protein
MRRAKFISLVMLFVVSVAIAPPLARAVESDTGATASGAQIAELIKNAKTAQDHLKIAQYFDKEAKRAEQRARDSASFARCYHETRRLSTRYAGPARNECIIRQKEYQKIAAEDRKLAKIHRELAAELEKEGKK